MGKCAAEDVKGGISYTDAAGCQVGRCDLHGGARLRVYKLTL